MNRRAFFILLIFLAFVSSSRALPQRLVIAMDGIAYRDVKALQAGVTYTNAWGIVEHREAFTAAEGYFPVSRMVSTFPSTSDVAWTDIFGNRPLPGYQRTFFSVTANSEVSFNGLTTTMEPEREMNWQMDNNFARSMGYIYSVHVYEHEVRQWTTQFWDEDDTNANFYVYLRSTDDAQHMDRDILSMLAMLDRDLQKMRARYQAKEGRDLEILIVSDHGHNHAGRGARAPVRAFLENNGYRIATSITDPKDVVLPTSGIEDWVEIHNAPAETEALAEKLTHLEGADIVTARLPAPTNCFLVLNTNNDRAIIRWNRVNNTFQYSAERGDPLGYLPMVAELKQKGKLDTDGFATADDWMEETMTNHYPVALERIARGLTCVTLNPATILISLDNHYVHAGWLVNAGSQLESCGSTHGALDDINSLGIVLSNFAPTHDTTSDRMAGYFNNFSGLRKYRNYENGGEWVMGGEQAQARIQRDPFDRDYQSLPAQGLFLRVWSPELAEAGTSESLQGVIEKISGVEDPATGAVTMQPRVGHEIRVTFKTPVSFPEKVPNERIYPCPANLGLEPHALYQLSGWVHGEDRDVGRFELVFRTDDQGRPVAY
jgi:hypothetical protein